MTSARVSRQHVSKRFALSLLFLSGLTIASSSLSAKAQQANLAPITLAQNTPVPTPGVVPTDATPFGLMPERESTEPGFQFRLNQALPENLWYSATVEASQRLDTNVLFTSKRVPQADYAFRILPNITVGYNFLKNTGIYCNYFVIKDVFANHGFLSKPTTQSVSLGLRHSLMAGRKTQVQFDFQARELWQVKGLRQSDLLPSVSVLHMLTPRTTMFGSALLQLRGGDYFTGGQREIDPFFSAGAVHQRNGWIFSVTDTFVMNYRNRATAIPNQSNMSMIMDIEAARSISKKHPGLQVFFRAEPIWNWHSNNVSGLSGFDFRLFSGVRMVAAKPSHGESIARIKKQILQQEQLNAPPTGTPPKSPDPDATSQTIPDSPSTSSSSPAEPQVPAEPAQTPATSIEPADSAPIQQASFHPAAL
ncbi:MAG: hypothetical protein SFY67_18475 [Candidatus Melainabacteria bacterium]|nr:hypothetical protein [Candidatus Melainabacteria bacterium]